MSGGRKLVRCKRWFGSSVAGSRVPILREACLSNSGSFLGGELELGDGRSITAKSVGCAAFRNAFGMSYRGYASAAFQSAADLLLKYLDEGYGNTNTP